MLLFIFLTVFIWTGEAATTKEALSQGRGAAGNACGDTNAVGDCRAPLQCLASGGQVTLSYTCPSTLLVCCTFTSGCGGSSRGRVSQWRNPSYPSTDVELPDLCSYSVTPALDTCYVRIEFTELTAPSALPDLCQDNVLTIYNQREGSGSSLCGAFTGYTTFVRVKPSWLWFTNPVQLSLRIRTSPFKFSVKFTQLRCADGKSFSVSSRTRRDAQFNFNPISSDGRKKPGPNFKPSKSELLAYKLAAQQAMFGSKTSTATLSYPASTIGLKNDLQNLAQDLALSLNEQTGIADGIYGTETTTDFMNDLDPTSIFQTHQPGFTGVRSPGHFSDDIGVTGFGTTDASLMTLNDMNLASTMSLQPINSQTELNSIIPNGHTSSYLPTDLPQNTNTFFEFSTPVSAGLNVLNAIGTNPISHPNHNQWLHSDHNIQNTFHPLGTSSPSLNLVDVTTGSLSPLDSSTSNTVGTIGNYNWPNTVGTTGNYNWANTVGTTGNYNWANTVGTTGNYNWPNTVGTTGNYNWPNTVDTTGNYNWPNTVVPQSTVVYPSSLDGPGSSSLLGNLNLLGNYERPGNFNRPVNLNRPGIIFRPNGKVNFTSNLEKLTASYLSENLGASTSNPGGNTVFGDDLNGILGLFGSNSDPTKTTNDLFSTHGTKNKFQHSADHNTPGMNNNYLTNLGDFSQHSLQLLNILASSSVAPQITISHSGLPAIPSYITGSFNKSGYFPFTTPSSTTLSAHNVMSPTHITIPLGETGGQKISSQVAGSTGIAYPQTGSSVSSIEGNNLISTVTESARPSFQPPGSIGITFPSRGNDGLAFPPGVNGVTLPMSGNAGATLTTFGAPGVTESSSFSTNGGGSASYRPSISGLSSNDPLDEALNSIVNNLNQMSTTTSPMPSFTTLTSSSRPTRPYRPGNPLGRPTTTLPRPPFRRPAGTATLPPLRSPAVGGGTAVQTHVSHRQPISTIFQSFLNKQSLAGPTSSSLDSLIRLAGGSATPPESFLFMGLSVLRTSDDTYHGCGAALISSKYALTAARCLLRKGLSQKYEVKVIFGPDRSILADNPSFKTIYSHSMSRKVAKVIFHPMVDHTTLRYDLAVLRVAQPYRNVPSASLPTRDAEFSGMGAILLGWGLSVTSQTSQMEAGLNAELQSLDAVVLSNADCNKAWTGIRNSYDYTGSAPVIENEMVCTRATAPSSGVCTGDEGGALIKKGANGEDILVGILSGAHHDCDQSSGAVTTSTDPPDVATRVSAFLDWIDAVTTEYSYPCGVDFSTFTYRQCIL